MKPSLRAQEARNLSAHERRMQRMAERARKLEAQNVGDKEWFMRGEADSGLSLVLSQVVLLHSLHKQGLRLA